MTILGRCSNHHAGSRGVVHVACAVALHVALVAGLPLHAQPAATRPQVTEGSDTATVAAPPYHVQAIGDRRVVEFDRTEVAEVWKLDRGGVQEVTGEQDSIRLVANELVTFRLPEGARRVQTDEMDWWNTWDPAVTHGGARDSGGQPIMDPDGQPTMDPDRWVLPYQTVGLDAQAEELRLQTVVQVNGGGLRPQSPSGFAGRLFAAVRDLERPREQRSLPSAIEILVTADVDEVLPHLIRLDHTNSWIQVDLKAANPRDPVVVTLAPSFESNPTSIEVPVVRGSLRLSITPRTIQGLGLETARVTVRATGLPSPEAVVVVLDSDKGSLEDTQVVLGAAGVASTSIRSVTTGTATVTAEGASMASSETTVHFAIPWLFLAAAVLGGVVGALIRRARTAKTKRRNLWADIFLLGVLAGVLVAAAYSVGINLLGLEPAARAGEAVVFVLSALGAYFGIPSRN